MEHTTPATLGLNQAAAAGHAPNLRHPTNTHGWFHPTNTTAVSSTHFVCRCSGPRPGRWPAHSNIHSNRICSQLYQKIFSTHPACRCSGPRTARWPAHTIHSGSYTPNCIKTLTTPTLRIDAEVHAPAVGQHRALGVHSQRGVVQPGVGHNKAAGGLWGRVGRGGYMGLRCGLSGSGSAQQQCIERMAVR